jgi:DNA-binding transcriptional LysR family regulator
LPRLLPANEAERFDYFELPFGAENFTLLMAWHPRNHGDPATRWLRDMVIWRLR